MTPADTPKTLDAYAIWLQTRSAVTSAQYPRKLDYTIDVSGLDGDRPTDDHYRAAYDEADGSIALFPISDETLAKPAPVPHGVNVSVNLFFCWIGCLGIHRQAGHPEASLDLLGEPLIQPTYAFGMRYERPHPDSSSSATGSLPVIATVSAQKPAYRVELIDQPAIDGVATYHLQLTPLRDPKNNRLRELWVGTSDYLPRRAAISGNFTRAPLVDVPWTIDFAIVDGVPYIARESAGATLYLAHGRVVRQAAIAFEDVREPAAIFGEPLVTPERKDDTLVEPGGT